MAATAGISHAGSDLYAAIAVGRDHVGEAANYPNQIAADQAALQACEHGVLFLCRIEARVHNACGSVVERDVRKPLGSGPEYFVGIGATAVAAQYEAREFAGPDRSSMLSKITKPAFVLDTICTSNAR